jgi:hypothetical protein
MYHHYAELFAFLVGCFVVKKQWTIQFKWLVVLAGISFFIELAGHIMWTRYSLNNNWIYNLFLPVQCFIFLYFFYKTMVQKVVRKIVGFLMGAMIAGTVISYFYHGSFTMLNSYASTLYLFLMLIASCLYYLDTIINEVEVSMTRQPSFWVAAGLLFFTVIFILLFALWAVNIKIPYYKVVLNYSVIIANTFLYGGLIAGFLCLHKTKNYYLHSW